MSGAERASVNMFIPPMDPQIPSHMTDREILETIWSKIVVIDQMNAKLNMFISRIENVETAVSDLKNQVHDLDAGVSHIETETEELKQNLEKLSEDTAKMEDINILRKEVIDLSNRSRRNNILIHNYPEGSERDKGCLNLVKDFLANELEMNPVPKIEVAHRSGRRKKGKGNKDTPPRVITARCILRPDRDLILETAAKKLKEKSVYITDDIHPYTREVHRKLVPVMKEMRQKQWLAYIPWKVPRTIQYKDTPKGTPGQLKTYYLPEDFTVTI